MWKNSLKCDFGHFLSKVKEEFVNQRKSFDPTLREAIKKNWEKTVKLTAWVDPLPRSGQGVVIFFKKNRAPVACFEAFGAIMQ